MEPSISVGDVALTKELDSVEGPRRSGHGVPEPGPSGGSLLIHRVVERLDDGGLVTAGDANQFTDSTPVTREALTRQAVLLVPYIGKPIAWLQAGSGYRWAGSARSHHRVAFVLTSRRLSDDDTEDLDDSATPPTAEPVRPARGGAHAAPRQSYVLVGRDRPAEPRPRSPAASRAGAALVAVMPGTATAAMPTDAAFTSRTKSISNSWTVASKIIHRTYLESVLTDDPYLLWLLDETGGTTAADRSGHGHTGTMTGIDAYGRPGAMPNNPGTAVQLVGSADRNVESRPSHSAPNSFTVEMSFKTTDTGKLIGFESGQGTFSLLFDRTVHIDSSGRVVYGASSSTPNKIMRSPGSFADGHWHHLAVCKRHREPGFPDRPHVPRRQEGRRGPGHRADPVLGLVAWWAARMAPDSDPLSTAGSLDAQLDGVAVYGYALSATRILEHYNLR